MAQLDADDYVRLTPEPVYGQSDGLYYKRSDGSLVMVVNGVAQSTFGAAPTAGKVMISDGTTVAPTALSGDVTVTGAGVTAIGAAKVLSSMLSPLTIQYTTVTASSAQLLAINATPKTVVAAPGAGFVTIIHKAILVLNYNSAAYANNGILGLYETNAAGTLLTGTLTLASFLAQTADTIKELHPTAASATTGLTRLDNKAVVLTQATGESITGNSPVDVHCWYSTVPHGL